MRKDLLNSLIFVVLLLPVTANSAEEGVAKKTVLIDELVELTSAKQIVDIISEQWAQQLLTTLEQQNVLNDDIQSFVLNEMQLLVDYNLIENNGLIELVYPFYDARFSEQELMQLLSFYRSPIGMKSIHHMPIDHEALIQFVAHHHTTLQTKITTQLKQSLIQQYPLLLGQ